MQLPSQFLPPRLRAYISTSKFARRYAVFAVLVLLLSTVFWALKSAGLQSGNADQLINPLLFEHSKTFHQATFPGAHSFLIKWPLFWLVKLLGFGKRAYGAVTLAVVLLTVGGLTYVIHRIEKRWLQFGTYCLALSSVLVLVPAQPYAGGLLPVNMAMLATRNLEYLLYILGLVLLIRSPSIKSRHFWLGVSCLSLLVASDKLFLSLSLGGALLALVSYSLGRNWRLVSLSVSWLVGSFVAGVIGTAVLSIIQASGLTHIASQSGTSPYGLVHGIHDVFIGVVYAVSGLFTNFGANPAYDATIVRHIPHQLLNRLFGVGGLAYIVNVFVFTVGIVLVWRVFRSSFSKQFGKRSFDNKSKLAVMLIWTSLAAIAVFVASKHYYAVDARYLTIALFAVFIGTAVALRSSKTSSEVVVTAGVVFVIALILGLVASAHTYTAQSKALSDISARNQAVAQVLNRHPVKVLVGDYWRVVPTKYDAGSKLNIMPLSTCTGARDALSSGAWQLDLHRHSFAYLLSLDKSLADYPRCNLAQVIQAYGRPNESTLISGSFKQPNELLLFYDRGAHKSSPKIAPLTQKPATVEPIKPDELPYTSCSGPTIMNVVAHQDDDLLFMNPNLLHDIKAGHCVRTIYVTAGDGGAGKFYWLSREQGSEAAYSSMVGSDDIWVQRIVEVAKNEFVTIANPRGNSKISLIFIHLPDGNLKGEGFGSSHFESLAKLEAGKINTMQTVDGQSTYSASQLIAALTSLMHIYQPAEIRTQASVMSTRYPDHSDHMAVGRFTQKAYVEYEKQQYAGLVSIPLQFYIGYPIHERGPDVSGSDLDAKQSAFLAYAKFDGGVCHTVLQCDQNPAYGAYLDRQYQDN